MAAARDKKSANTAQPTNGTGVASSAVNGAGVAGTGGILIDLEFVRQLIAAVDVSGIDTLEISRAGTRIRISKSPFPAKAVAAVTPEPSSLAAPGAVSASSPAAQEAPAATESRNLVDVRSPMVGTFYRAPAPEAPPYVEVGGTITRGQTLCILEAMKLMNEMESELDGVVREILVENADPVEYGQILFRIEPTGSA
jgi:acetyl-CoA carboxylase biotin carboxyl carrier protein